METIWQALLVFGGIKLLYSYQFIGWSFNTIVTGLVVLIVLVSPANISEGAKSMINNLKTPNLAVNSNQAIPSQRFP